MNRDPLPAPYTLKRVRELLGLSRGVLSGLMAAGFVAPTRGPRNECRFSFQDLMLLRTAHGLRQAGIKPRKILRALGSLKAQLPPEVPLTGLRISAVGSDVVVRDRHGQLQAASGQWVIAFDVQPADGGSVDILPPAAAAKASPELGAGAQGRTEAQGQAEGRPEAEGRAKAGTTTAAVDFEQGIALEACGELAQAEAAYRRAIAADPGDVRPGLNLGALLCESGRFAEARALYRQALADAGPEALLHFNLGVAAEGDADPASALASYRQAIALDPDLADAHYNLAVLLQRLDDPQGALRHLSAYRRLQGSTGVS